MVPNLTSAWHCLPHTCAYLCTIAIAIHRQAEKLRCGAGMETPSLHMMRAYLRRLLCYARCVDGPSRAQNGVRQYCMVCCRALACMACNTTSARKTLHCCAENSLQVHWLQALLTMCAAQVQV